MFVPKINKHLKIWKDGWVNHKLSPEAQYTPLQLFASRMLDDDYQNNIFQENVLVSYKFQLTIFTYFLRNSANLLNNLPSHDQIEKCSKSLVTVFIIDGASMTNKMHFKKIELTHFKPILH